MECILRFSSGKDTMRLIRERYQFIEPLIVEYGIDPNDEEDVVVLNIGSIEMVSEIMEKMRCNIEFQYCARATMERKWETATPFLLIDDTDSVEETISDSDWEEVRYLLK